MVSAGIIPKFLMNLSREDEPESPNGSKSQLTKKTVTLIIKKILVR